MFVPTDASAGAVLKAKLETLQKKQKSLQAAGALQRQKEGKAAAPSEGKLPAKKKK